ncbi:MAG: pilus assembly FimT family protein [Caldimicrobium sp.]
MAGKIRSPGYTLFETLIVILIIGIFSAIFLREVLNYIAYARLREAANQFIADLQYAKNMAQVTGLSWGIRGCGNSSYYKIFIDHDGDCKDTDLSCNPSNPDETKVCVNKFNTSCSSDSDCAVDLSSPVIGSCRPRTIYKTLSKGIIFSGSFDFYVVFDRKGYPFNYSCGFGAVNATLVNQNNSSLRVIIDKLGRIRVET